MFQAEASTLASLHHPNILRFVGVGFAGPTELLPRRVPRWIVTELCPYSLHDFLRLPGVEHTLRLPDILCMVNGLSLSLCVCVCVAICLSVSLL